MKVEIKNNTDNTYTIIIYNDNGTSQGSVISKNDLYELYIQLREIFKK
jgi:hypothetical protein